VKKRMTSGHDDEFTILVRLLDGSGDASGGDGSEEASWVRARAMELVRSADRIHGSGDEKRSTDTDPSRHPAPRKDPAPAPPSGGPEALPARG